MILAQESLNTSKGYMLVFIASTSKRLILVSMRLSEKYAVPRELALLYDFVNSLDERRYVENGAAHTGGDQLASPRLMESWMREHGLWHRGEHADPCAHQAALELRRTLRAFLLNPPAERRESREAARQLTAASRSYPLLMGVTGTGDVEMLPFDGTGALGLVLAQMIALAQAGRLDRLKTCASKECHWIFFDRSKPANRHWCASAICGNRQKTRAYRQRQRHAS